MILFPNAKLNLGLRILMRRPDGYHNLSTVMIPLPWCDVLEIVPGEGRFALVGEDAPDFGAAEDNLVMKALRAVERHLGHSLPPVDIYLKKNIPFGAGMGGGSADAAFAIRGFNEYFNLGLSDEVLASIAATVGADCPFFIYNRPMLAEGIGEVLSEIELPQLVGKICVVAMPRCAGVSTREAYAGVSPKPLDDGESLQAMLSRPVAEWAEAGVVNDFEKSIFPIRPEIAQVKQSFIDSGALYVAMSGSGSAVFAIFDDDKMADAALAAVDSDSTFKCRLLER